MKHIIFISLLFVSAISFGQGKVESDGKIKPTGTYTIVDIKDVTGNAYEVPTIAARNAIPANRRTNGFIAFVIADSSHYTLIGGVTNEYWQKFGSGAAGANGSQFFIEPGLPNVSLGVDGDIYLNRSTNTLYKKEIPPGGTDAIWVQKGEFGGGGGGNTLIKILGF